MPFKMYFELTLISNKKKIPDNKKNSPTFYGFFQYQCLIPGALMTTEHHRNRQRSITVTLYSPDSSSLLPVCSTLKAQSPHCALMSPSPVSKLGNLSLSFTTAAALMKASRFSCRTFPFSNYPDMSL